MTHDKLKQLFDQNADCHISTTFIAMTESKFIEVVSALIASDTEIEKAAEVKYPYYSGEVEIVEANRTAYISALKDLRDGGINRDKTN